MNVLVTGATAGFGQAIAERLVRDGHTVFATGRRSERLTARAERCGSGLVPYTLDVRDRAQVESVVQRIVGEHGQIDALINNAGLALGLAPAQSANLDDWETMVDTNIKGLMYCTRAVLPAMVERDRGWIVNIGSTAATYPYPGGNVYGATKAFVRQFSLNLRADLVGKGVRVTTIEPGLVGGTEFSVTRFGGDTEKAAGVYKGTQALDANDIAQTVAWVLSLPEHVNINALELMPTCQAAGPLAIARKT